MSQKISKKEVMKNVRKPVPKKAPKVIVSKKQKEKDKKWSGEEQYSSTHFFFRNSIFFNQIVRYGNSNSAALWYSNIAFSVKCY